MGENSTSKPEFFVTDRARDEALKASAALDPPPYGLRVGILGGGCSGYSYHMAWNDEAHEDDHIFHFGRLKVLIDPKSMQYLDGATMRWGESLSEYGFQFDNPNVEKACGCGSSFTI